MSKVPKEDVSQDEIISMLSGKDSDLLSVMGIVEKPNVADATSDVISIGHYVDGCYF